MIQSMQPENPLEMLSVDLLMNLIIKPYTLENGVKMVFVKVKAYRYGMMAAVMRDSGRMIWQMVEVV